MNKQPVTDNNVYNKINSIYKNSDYNMFIAYMPIKPINNSFIISYIIFDESAKTGSDIITMHELYSYLNELNYINGDNKDNNKKYFEEIEKLIGEQHIENRKNRVNNRNKEVTKKDNDNYYIIFGLCNKDHTILDDSIIYSRIEISDQNLKNFKKNIYALKDNIQYATPIMNEYNYTPEKTGGKRKYIPNKNKRKTIKLKKKIKFYKCTYKSKST